MLPAWLLFFFAHGVLSPMSQAQQSYNLIPGHAQEASTEMLAYEDHQKTTKWPVTFFLLWPLLVILSGVTPRSASTLAIPLASTPQLGATLDSQRRWTFILQTVRRHREETAQCVRPKRVPYFFLIVKVIRAHWIGFGKCRKTQELTKNHQSFHHTELKSSTKPPYTDNHCLLIK